MPKFLGNNYENYRFSVIFAPNFVNLRSSIYVKGHPD